VVRLPYRYKGELRHADEYVYRVKRNGRNHYFKLGSDKKKAGKKADDIAAFLSVATNSIGDAIANYSPAPVDASESSEELAQVRVPTIGQICERYVEKAVHLSPTTVKHNCNALRHLAASVMGLKKIKAKDVAKRSAPWRKKVDAISLDKLTLRALEDYRGGELRKAGQDGLLRARVITTTNSYFRTARSIFAERMLVHYDDFKFPDPLPLRQIKPLREPSHRYISRIDLAAIIGRARKRWWDGVPDEEGATQLAEQEAHTKRNSPKRLKKTPEILRVEERACFIILLLTAACGLRPKEISKLLWENVDLEQRRLFVAVTSYDTPKAKNSENHVDLSPEVADYVKQFREYSPLEVFVLPSPSFGSSNERAIKRCGYLFVKLRTWLRKEGVDHHTPLYIFRKEAGSLVYSQTDSIDKAAEFLRNDPRVAREHYVARKDRLEVSLPGLLPAS